MVISFEKKVALGHTAQIPYHLNRAMDNGLTQEQVSEVLTHIAFYAGWPCAFSALPVIKDVLEKRQNRYGASSAVLLKGNMKITRVGVTPLEASTAPSTTHDERTLRRSQ